MEDYSIEPIYRIIGQKIRESREQLNWSQAELAIKMKVSTPAITHYENATRRIPLHHLKQIAYILGKSYEFFTDEASVRYSKSTKDQIISVANLISDGKYLPIIDFDLRLNENYDCNDFSDKKLYPFPCDIVEKADVAYRIFKDDKIKYFLIDITNNPMEGDLIFTIESDVFIDDNDEIEGIVETYHIANYRDGEIMVDFAGTEYPLDKNRYEPVGIIKTIIETK